MSLESGRTDAHQKLARLLFTHSLFTGVIAHYLFVARPPALASRCSVF
jgi:hypothetical protein